MQNFRKQEIISDIILRLAFLGCSSRLGIALGLQPRAVLGCSSEPRSWLCGGGYLLHSCQCAPDVSLLQHLRRAKAPDRATRSTVLACFLPCLVTSCQPASLSALLPVGVFATSVRGSTAGNGACSPWSAPEHTRISQSAHECLQLTVWHPSVQLSASQQSAPAFIHRVVTCILWDSIARGSQLHALTLTIHVE